MIENISHITFVVRDLDRTAKLYKELFGAKEVYDSGEKGSVKKFVYQEYKGSLELNLGGTARVKRQERD